MEKTSKPIVAGLLSIAAGVAGLGLVARMLFNLDSMIGVGNGANSDAYHCGTGIFIIEAFTLFFAFILFICSLFAVNGGIFTLRRKKWSFVQNGAVLAIIAFFPLGIPAFILTRKSEKEISAEDTSVSSEALLLIAGLGGLLSGIMLFGWLYLTQEDPLFSIRFDFRHFNKTLIIIGVHLILSLLSIIASICAGRIRSKWLVVAGSIAIPVLIVVFPLVVRALIIFYY